MVVINQLPIHRAEVSWTEREVELRLPAEINARVTDGTACISLIVDGMETNALPFHLFKKRMIVDWENF